jgi:hypothetical protein
MGNFRQVSYFGSITYRQPMPNLITMDNQPSGTIRSIIRANKQVGSSGWKSQI